MYLPAKVRLLDRGVKNLELTKLDMWLRRTTLIKKTYEKRKKYFVRLLQSSQKMENETKRKFIKLSIIMDRRAKALSSKIERARFMFSKLANASWNTTEAFVDSIG